ncbi:phosphopantetheine-binding protein [Micromonospora sp. NPDC093277]|uniref:phosphopantetheine-binding protein n=1 Tax=Micromonospora sp. NPDC093277 TaxID=3364291 RepID=UPI003829699E
MTTEQAPGRSETAVYEVVAAAWSAALNRDPVTDDDDFFALGGDSLAAMRMAASLRTALDVQVRMNAVFQHPTLAEFVASLRAEYGPEVEKAAEQYLTVLGYSDDDVQAAREKMR